MAQIRYPAWQDQQNIDRSRLYFTDVSTMTKRAYQQAKPEDKERLADLRVTAMRPSLEAIGRFDPKRARDRFLASFRAKETWLIQHQGQFAGFFVVRPRTDHVLLDHLYVDPACQGHGLGKDVVYHVQDQARQAGLPVHLAALRDSPANAFYLSQGFCPVREESFDIYYRWQPD